MVVVNLLLHRGHCNSFSHTIPPLQAAPSFACSVASLSRFPDHQLPGCSHLRERILADCLLGWGAASAQSAGHAQLQTTPSPKPERNRGNPHVILMCHLICTFFVLTRPSRFDFKDSGRFSKFVSALTALTLFENHSVLR